FKCDGSSDVCSSDLATAATVGETGFAEHGRQADSTSVPTPQQGYGANATTSGEDAMMIRKPVPWIAAMLLLAVAYTRPVFAQRPEKDYLSGVEADKIRDAETPNERIKLFLEFAQDRLKKFQYELEHPSPNKHTEMLNYLMNSYIGCVDDAADIIQVGL